MREIDKHPAIRELFSIVRLRSELERHAQLIQWKNRWIEPIESRQLVLNKKKLSSEDHDMLCEHVVKQSIDRIIEEKLVNFDITDNYYASSMMVLRNEKFKANK
jgi:hypothetical protein